LEKCPTSSKTPRPTSPSSPCAFSSQPTSAPFNAPSLEEVREQFKKTIKKYQKTAPEVAAWMETALPEGFTIFSLREQVRRRLRTSHRLVNLNKQIRRRTKVVSIFPNKESGLRLIASILMESSDDWESGRSSLNPVHLSSQNNQTETQTVNLMRIDTFTEKKLRCLTAGIAAVFPPTPYLFKGRRGK
jgi:hypothetical protein